MNIPPEVFKKMIHKKLVRSTELVEELCEVLQTRVKRYGESISLLLNNNDTISEIGDRLHDG